ncbi:MAG: hypothetical protein M3285_01240 [Actinomycetota bacterium]|nr:hypothetical protein [Actinomycetota bacterium]
MAIKGKKKSQKRGAQGGRRPTAPPRPMVQPRKRVPWYRTPLGFVISAVVAIALIGVIVWAVQNNRENARSLSKKQDSLERYTGQVRTTLQTLRAPVAAMGAVASSQGADPALFERLAKDAEGWTEDLTAATADLGAQAPTDAVLQSTNRLYAQAIQLYSLAATTLEVVPDTEGDAQQRLLLVASQQLGQGGAIWVEATTLLDRARTTADLEPSGLTSPEAAAGAQPPAPVPGATGLPPGVPPEGVVPPPEEQAVPEDGGGNDAGGNDAGGNDGKGGGKGGGKDGGGSQDDGG